MMLGALLLFSLAASGTLAGGGAEEKRIRKIIDAWNLDAECWGRDNMLAYWAKRTQAIAACADYAAPGASLSPENPFSALNAAQPNPISRLLDQAISGNSLNEDASVTGWSDLLGSLEEARAPRQSRPIAAGASAGAKEFLAGLSQHKESTATKLGNLTCVLAELGKLDSRMQINMDYFTNNMWTNIDLSASKAGQDPVWREKVNQGFGDCYNLATSWPQAVLDRHPVTKVMGRHHVFFTCAKKVLRKQCIKALEFDWMEQMGATDTEVKGSPLPLDKYDRAALSVLMMQEKASDEERFVTDFFTEDGHY